VWIVTVLSFWLDHELFPASLTLVADRLQPSHVIFSKCFCFHNKFIQKRPPRLRGGLYLESLRDSLTKFTIDYRLKAHLSLIMSEIAWKTHFNENQKPSNPWTTSRGNELSRRLIWFSFTIVLTKNITIFFKKSCLMDYFLFFQLLDQ
jgi:hypothetical protein